MKNFTLIKNSYLLILKYIIAGVLSLFTLVQANNLQAQQRYNVILINVDDMSIACELFGNSFAPTPNLKRLADRGVLFNNVYTQYSLCSPSRSSAFSGTRVPTTLIVNNVDSIRKGLGSGFRFLPEYFHDFGYRTEGYGKFMCNHDKEVSWDYFFATRDTENYFSGNEDGGLTTASKQNRPTQPDEQQDPTWYIDTLNKVLSTTNDGRETDKFTKALENPVTTPFFYSLGLETHNAFTPIIEYWNKTGDNTVFELLPVDAGFVYTDVYGNGSSNIPVQSYPANDRDDIPEIALKPAIIYPYDEIQRLRHAYYSEMTQVDANVGLVLDKIDQLNLWENSVIVFWSDHGLSMGEHNGMYLKTNMFEEALRVPMIICAPGIRPGVCDRLVESVDLFQTLTELCNIPEMANREGSSMVPLLQNPNFKWKKAIFSNLQKNNEDTLLGTAVRTDSWHYNYWQEEGEELYNIVNDPKEITNLALNPAYTDTLQKMRSLLNGGWQGAKPPVYSLKSYFKDEDGDGYGNSVDSLYAYAKPNGYTLRQGDCNDNDARINPGANERPCNNKDDNCTSGIDENKPVPSITANGSLDLCVSEQVTLSTNRGSGLSYQWMINGDKIPGATNRNLITGQVGTYTVKVSTPSCNNTSAGVFVYRSNCRFLDEITAENSMAKSPDLASLSIAPNPSTGIFVLQHTSKIDASIPLVIYNTTGQVVFTQNIIVRTGNNKHQLNLSKLEAGAYELSFGDFGRLKIIKM